MIKINTILTDKHGRDWDILQIVYGKFNGRTYYRVREHGNAFGRVRNFRAYRSDITIRKWREFYYSDVLSIPADGVVR